MSITTKGDVCKGQKVGVTDDEGMYRQISHTISDINIAEVQNMKNINNTRWAIQGITGITLNEEGRAISISKWKRKGHRTTRQQQ